MQTKRTALPCLPPEKDVGLKVVLVEYVLEHRWEVCTRQLYVLLRQQQIAVGSLPLPALCAPAPATSCRGALTPKPVPTVKTRLRTTRNPSFTCISLSETSVVTLMSLRSAGRPAKFDSEPGARSGLPAFCCDAVCCAATTDSFRLCTPQGFMLGCMRCRGRRCKSLAPTRTCLAFRASMSAQHVMQAQSTLAFTPCKKQQMFACCERASTLSRAPAA